MDYNTSHLIYRSQQYNAEEIYKAKKRLIKNATPLLRSFTDDDLVRFSAYQEAKSELISKVQQDCTRISSSKNGITDPAVIQLKDDQIIKRKLAWLKDHSVLRAIYSTNKSEELESLIKMLVLLYCTWSEATFVKIKHTPHGLILSERWDPYGRSIGDKWNSLINTILMKIPASHIGAVQQMRHELSLIAEQHIIAPSKWRNKLAHGQWAEALNQDNNDLNLEVSLTLASIDLVKMDISFDIHYSFAEILQSILESNDPDAMVITRHDSYLFLKNKLDSFINKTQLWNLASRCKFLRQRSFNVKTYGLTGKC